MVTLPILIGSADNSQLVVLDRPTTGALTLCGRVIPRNNVGGHFFVLALISGVEPAADVELVVDYHLKPYPDDIGGQS